MNRRAFLTAAAGVGMATAGCTETIHDDGGQSGAVSVSAEELRADVDPERIHNGWESASGAEFNVWGWTRVETVVVADGDDTTRSVSPTRDVFFQPSFTLATDESIATGEIELLLLESDRRYRPIEELPDGTDLGAITDDDQEIETPFLARLAAEDAELSGVDATEQNPTNPIFDVEGRPGTEPSVIDISPFVPDEEAPRYLWIAPE
ncbi:MAG: hypothetical protein PPP58_00300 [Natronomonas sp.]